MLAAVESICVVPPTLTFSDRLTLYGSRRIADLFCLGGGHTEGDVCLFLPAEGILFAGDLVAVQFHPLISHSATGWLAILARLQALAIHRIVPGHGPLGTIADVETMRAYISDMRQLARDLAERKVTPDAFADVPLLPAYTDWQAGNVAEWNLHCITEQLRDSR